MAEFFVRRVVSHDTGFVTITDRFDDYNDALQFVTESAWSGSTYRIESKDGVTLGVLPATHVIGRD